MAEKDEPVNRAQRTKITLKDIGIPALVNSIGAETLAKSGGKLILGRLIGIATKFVQRTSADKTETFEGLGGVFRVVPNRDVPGQGELEELESGVLFVPEAYHNIIADGLRKAQSTDPNATATFSFQVSAIPAKNPAGYSWEFLPLLKPSGMNPLDDLWSETVKLAPPKGAARIAAR